jgi:hypothetical protein
MWENGEAISGDGVFTQYWECSMCSFADRIDTPPVEGEWNVWAITQDSLGCMASLKAKIWKEGIDQFSAEVIAENWWRVEGFKEAYLPKVVWYAQALPKGKRPEVSLGVAFTKGL